MTGLGWGFQRWRSRNSPTLPPRTLPRTLAITCLLEDILVSVLRLLVSVTTIAEGKREVWEYWGGSCLCAYTAERGETSSRHGKARAEHPSAALRQVTACWEGASMAGTRVR